MPPRFDPVPSFSLSLVAFRLLDFPLSFVILLVSTRSSIPTIHASSLSDNARIYHRRVHSSLYIRIFARHRTSKFQLFERAMLLASFRVAQATNKPVDSFQNI